MAIDLQKMFSDEKRQKLKAAIKSIEDDGFWVVDYDEEEKIVILEKWDDGEYETYKTTYETEDYKTISFKTPFTKVEAIRSTDYVEVGEEQEPENIVEVVVKTLNKYFGGSNKQLNTSVVKQFDDVKHTTVEILYVPPIESGGIDGVGDGYYEEDLDSMLNSFNKANEEGRLQYGLFHKHKSNAYRVTKAYKAEEDCVMGEFNITKGTPLIEIEYLNEELYEQRKLGNVMGPSIGARAKDIIIVEDGVEKSLGEQDIYIGKASPLDEIKSKPKLKRILKSIHFDFPHPEITLTDASQGGACSMMNDIILEKSMKKPNDAQAAILEAIGEEFVPLEKKLNQDSDSADNTGVNKTENEGTDMSVELQKEIAELKKQLKVEKLEKAFDKYELGEAKEALVDLVAEMESGDVVIKALEAMLSAKETAVTKAKEEIAPENPVAKALSEEKGEGGEPEAEVQKSLQDIVIEKLEAQVKGAK